LRLTAEKIHGLGLITRVLGLFVPPAAPLMKLEEVYVRTMDDVKITKVEP
jgi:hypothetical protein